MPFILRLASFILSGGMLLVYPEDKAPERMLLDSIESGAGVYVWLSRYIQNIRTHPEIYPESTYAHALLILDYTHIHPEFIQTASYMSWKKKNLYVISII